MKGYFLSIKHVVGYLRSNFVVEKISEGEQIRIKEIPHLHRPAYAVYIKQKGQKKGKHVFTVLGNYNQPMEQGKFGYMTKY